MHRRSGSLNADQGGRGEERGGNQEDGEQGAAAAGGKGLAEAGFVQKAFNALGEMTGAGHGNSCEGWAREGREFKQELSVGGAAGGFFQAGARGGCTSTAPAFASSSDPQRKQAAWPGMFSNWQRGHCKEISDCRFSNAE